MGSKKSFVIYTAWKSFFELLDEPALVKELLFAVFSLAEGEEVVITNNKVSHKVCLSPQSVSGGYGV